MMKEILITLYGIKIKMEEITGTHAIKIDEMMEEIGPTLTGTTNGKEMMEGATFNNMIMNSQVALE